MLTRQEPTAIPPRARGATPTRAHTQITLAVEQAGTSQDNVFAVKETVGTHPRMKENGL